MLNLITIYIPAAFSLFCLVAFYGLAKQELAGRILAGDTDLSVSSCMRYMLSSSFIAGFISVNYMVKTTQEIVNAEIDALRKFLESTKENKDE